MKQRFLLSFLFVFTCMVAAQAQIGKGSTWLGGNIGYSQANDKTESSTTTNKQRAFHISPAIGTAVKENLILGVSATYWNSTSKGGSSIKGTNKGYGGGIFIRRYFPVVNRLYIFGEAKAYYQAFRAKTNTNGYDIRDKGWSSGIALTPGLSYGITKYLQLETGLNSLFSTAYQKRTSQNGFTEIKNSSFITGISLDNASQIYIGFRFLINKKA